MKGEVKDQFGKLTNDEGKQVEGKIDKAKGSLKNASEEIKDTFHK